VSVPPAGLLMPNGPPMACADTFVHLCQLRKFPPVVRGITPELHCSELSQRCVDERREVIAAAMASVVENVEPTGRPTLGEPPSRLQWCADDAY
jgi:hypothetical protein